MNIYQRVLAVMADMPNFELDGQNKAQKFKFVSIKNIYNTLRVLMVKHGVVSFPSGVIKSNMNVMTTKKWDSYNNREKESTMFYCEVTAEFTFTCEDGSRFTAVAEGGASDYSDKAQGQAMTNAHKNALKQVFMIAEGDPDADSPGLNDNVTANRSHKQPIVPTDGEITQAEMDLKSVKTLQELKEVNKKYPHMKSNTRYLKAGREAMDRITPQPQAS